MNRFIPYGSEEWTREQWSIFDRYHPQPFGVYSFSGDDYCNDGEGNCSWDGESRRCNCGNRRVYWCFIEDYVYPEAW